MISYIKKYLFTNYSKNNIKKHISDYPKSLSKQENIKQRIDMLDMEHIKPLTDFVRDLRNIENAEIPYFDPLDGGIKAKYLFLLEKPGKMALESEGGSGFVSRNNNDETAKNIYNFLEEAKIARKDTIIWNSIAPWNGKTRITAEEVSINTDYLIKLLQILPKISTIILVGKKAQKFEKIILEKYSKKLKIIKSYHPSPKNKALAPKKFQSILEQWKKIK